MPLYRIYWDAGYGRNSETIEASDHQEAVNNAYEAAREDFENNADYGAKESGSEEDDD